MADGVLIALVVVLGAAALGGTVGLVVALGAAALDRLDGWRLGKPVASGLTVMAVVTFRAVMGVWWLLAVALYAAFLFTAGWALWTLLTM